MILFAMGAGFAVLVFFAFLWSLAQIARTSGYLRIAHAAAALATLLLFALGGLEVQVLLLQGAGCIMAAAGACAVVFEERWSRLIPLILAAAGVAVAAGLPFG